MRIASDLSALLFSRGQAAPGDVTIVELGSELRVRFYCARASSNHSIVAWTTSNGSTGVGKSATDLGILEKRIKWLAVALAT